MVVRPTAAYEEEVDSARYCSRTLRVVKMRGIRKKYTNLLIDSGRFTG